MDDAPPPFPDDAVEVARILGAWGVKGGIKLKPFAADPQALFASKRWFVRPGPLPRPATAPALPALLKVREARDHNDHVVALCHGLDDRDAAQALAGARIFVSRASFPSAAADEFYWVDLIGCAVVNREQQRLGLVNGLLDTGPQSVLCVTPDDAAAAELLIPFVDAYIDRVDLPARTVHVDWQADY
jgi:16S rRNA processing protein RimM